MADILNTEENYNPKLGLKNIYAKLIEIIAKVNTLWASLVAQPKVYKALLTQTGTDAPVATVLVNTLSGTPVWSYASAGQYYLTLNGEFLSGKTLGLLSLSLIGNYTLNRVSDNVYQLVTFDDSNAVADSMLEDATIIIEVYP